MSCGLYFKESCFYFFFFYPHPQQKGKKKWRKSQNFTKRSKKLARKMLINLCANIIALIRNTINSNDFIEKYKNSPEDFTRKSLLNFPTLFSFITNNLRSSNQHELDEFFRSINGAELPDIEVSSSAFSQARRKLNFEAFCEVISLIRDAFYHML